MRKAVIYQFVLVGLAMVVLIVVLLRKPEYTEVPTRIQIVTPDGDALASPGDQDDTPGLPNVPGTPAAPDVADATTADPQPPDPGVENVIAPVTQDETTYDSPQETLYK